MMDQMIGGGAAAPSPDLIKDTDMRNFGEDVIVASRTRPVIVDFWADWCGPCKQLMPALEAAVTAAKGAVALVKVNADQNQALCAQLQVQSLPTVLAFWQGQPVDGFQGAVPASHLKTFIDRLIQATGAEGGDEGDGIAEALAHADAQLAAGDAMTAAQIYQQILAHQNDNVPALVGMAEAALKLGQGEQAGVMLDTLTEDALKDTAVKARVGKVRAALELAAQAEGAGDPAVLEIRLADDPMNHQLRFDLALAYQGRGDFGKAAEALLGIIMRDREWNSDAARVQLLKLFEAHGAADPFTLKYRRRLSSVLFS